MFLHEENIRSKVSKTENSSIRWTYFLYWGEYQEQFSN